MRRQAAGRVAIGKRTAQGSARTPGSGGVIRARAVRVLAVLGALVGAGCADSAEHYDVLLRDGTVYDGSGDVPVRADIGVIADTIAAVGDLSAASADLEIDATGMAVTPGFINMLSWATESLLEDPHSQSDIRQGVTLEVMGEGESMGPLNAEMKAFTLDRQSDFTFDVPWTTLGEYLEHLEARGVSTNVASFIGATTLRVHEVGYEDRPPTEEELDRMRALVRSEMEAGALGIGSSLIYAPAFYASTEELIELSRVAAEYGGTYISHMRSEGNRLLDSVDELITIAREAGIPAEIYHLKMAGAENWEKLDAVIARVQDANAQGLDIRADMYTYTAGSTGLDAAMPPWVQEGGLAAWRERLTDPAVRSRVAVEMRTATDEWENLLLASGSPENAIIVGFRQDSLRHHIGKSLAAVAAEYGTSVEETAMDLVVKDDSRVDMVYFMMSEDNVRRQIALPWVTFGSDAGSLAPEGVFLNSNPHPRAYGNFARLLGRYVRDEQVIPLQEAVRKLTSLPADNLGLRRRGRLQVGHFADIVVFDPLEIQDHATFEDPHRYATGVLHVLVNGTPVLRDGEHTGATPGRFVRGPGWTGWQ